MTRSLAFLFFITWAATGWAGMEPYGYPFNDPFQATVVGTPKKLRADLPKDIPFKQRSMKIFKDRKVPDLFFYSEEFRYTYAAQDKAAPLIFLIPGTGGSATSDNLKIMASAFYQAGFHVVTVSSPTHENFIVSASRTSVPGDAIGDAEDLYRVMERIWSKLKTDIEVTDFFVAGYSLGGYNTAFVAWLDEQRRIFKFKKALLINPPVNPYNSISLLDRMLENIPGGVDNYNLFFQRIMEGVTQVYKRSSSFEINEETLYQAFQSMQLKNEELAALIGVVFRQMVSNMAFTSDVMTNFGYIKPKNLRFTRNSSLTTYKRVAARLGFTDYFHEYFYPYHKARDPSLTRKQLLDRMSLTTIEDYLSSTTKVEVIHNEDDPTLNPGEIGFFRRVFGDRSRIYPTGGHLGNITFRHNVVNMIAVFEQFQTINKLEKQK
jgi:predicted alpha/beta-fold hydrolase